MEATSNGYIECTHVNRNGNKCGLPIGHDDWHFNTVVNSKKNPRNWDNPSMRFVYWGEDGKRVTAAQREAVAG